MKKKKGHIMKQTKHDNGLERIIKHPNMFLKNKIKFIAKEVKIYRPDESLLSEIDILAYDGELYNIEYKSSIKHIDKAMHQLRIQRDFIKGIYPRKLNSIFMYATDKDILKKKIS